MAETIEIEGNTYAISGYTDNNVPIIKGFATSIHHKDENGEHIFDEDGNPKVSVHVSASPIEAVPTAEQE